MTKVIVLAMRVVARQLDKIGTNPLRVPTRHLRDG